MEDGSGTNAIDWGDFDHHRTDVDELHARYSQLHGSCPVAHSSAHGGFYVLADPEQVRRAAGDWQTFSSAGGTRLPKAPFRIAAIEFDPPEHVFWRDLYLEVLNLATFRWFEDRIRQHVDQLLDAFVGRGRAELVGELTEPIPVITVCEIIGITDPERQLATRRIALQVYAAQGKPDALREALRQFAAFCMEEVEERRRQPRDDFLTRLGTREAGGALLTDDQIVFMVAGHHSTSSALASVFRHIAEDPGLRDRLLADHRLIPRAIEETVRLDTPLHGFFRQTTQKVEIGGVDIPAGAEVMLNYAAANRDPGTFEHPDRFDIDRPRNAHLAFGHGIHACVGSNLARLELRITLEQAIPRLPDLRLVEGGAHSIWTGGNLYLLERLDVEFTPTKPAAKR